MSAIPIGKTMDTYQPVFEPDGDFIRGISFIGTPECNVIQEVSQFRSYLPFIYSDVFIVFSKLGNTINWDYILNSKFHIIIF